MKQSEPENNKKQDKKRPDDQAEILSKIGSSKALEMFQKMIEIRQFEERIKLLFLEGKMPGTIHQYIGEEACAVGVCTALGKDDIIASTHRPHGHAIARGLSFEELMAELYGKTTGCCKGKGGSMHVGDISKGMLPAIAIVGGNLPVVVGMALSFKLRGESRIAVSFFGDGASNEGAFHESLNMASIYNIPAVFVCENNQYGASTNIKLSYKLTDIADRACAYGMRADIADGMDVLDVYFKAKKAINMAREGHGPTLLELKTFRLCGHSRRDSCNYMTKEEIEYWKTKDPISSFENLLIRKDLLSNAKAEKIRKIVDEKIDRAIEFAAASPDPKPEDTYEDLYVGMEVPR
jgi:acetoin:2,6-dichlorophenolindophenol oxidoreductase subunit alpha